DLVGVEVAALLPQRAEKFCRRRLVVSDGRHQPTCEIAELHWPRSDLGDFPANLARECDGCNLNLRGYPGKSRASVFERPRPRRAPVGARTGECGKGAGPASPR